MFWFTYQRPCLISLVVIWFNWSCDERLHFGNGVAMTYCQEANLGGKSPNRSVPKWLEIDWNFTSGDLALYKKWPSQLSCIDDIDVLCKGTKGIQQITTCLSIPMERWRNHTLCYQSSFCNVSVRWMVSHVIDGSPVHAVLSHMRHMSTACPQLALLDSSGLHPSPCCDTRNHVSLDCLTLIPFLP